VAVGLIHASDAGQYKSLHFAQRLALGSIAPRPGRSGTPRQRPDGFDHRALRGPEYISRGRFQDGPLKTVSDVGFATATWVEWWNTTGLHDTLGHVPPCEFEAAHH
jgi:putative transposase